MMLKNSVAIDFSCRPRRDSAAKLHSFVAVPTPVDEHNNPDLTPVVKASETVGRHHEAKGAIVVYESTVYPG